jgi:hypothetical protein
MNPLKWYSTVVAGVTLAPNVNVAVYAWFSDVELCTPIPQSEMSGAVGAVGKKVTSAKGFASKFAHMALDAGLTAAGLGNPAAPMTPAGVVDMHPLRIKADGVSQVDTLYHHSVVEAPITPLGVDEMDFKAIYSKEAYLTQLNWTDAATPQNLFFTNVSPMISSEVGLTATGRTGGIQYLPMGFIGLPFQYWRGSIKFRVQVVAPKMVRGVLRLQYLPRAYTAPSYVEDCGDTFCTYIDISESAEAEMVIPYTANRPWLTAIAPVSTVGTANYSNGVFLVSIVEPLVSNSVGVSVNIFASGVDLEFANLFGVAGAGGHAFQSRFICTTDEAYPQSPTLDVFRSIRDVIKVPSRVIEVDDVLTLATNFAYYFELDTGPLSPGVDSLGIDDFNLTPLSWYSSGFLARRGKVRTYINSLAIGGTAVGSVFEAPVFAPMVGVYESSSVLSLMPLSATAYISTVKLLSGGYHAYSASVGEQVVVADVPSYSFGSYTFARPRSTAYTRPLLGVIVQLGVPTATGAATTGYTVYQCASDDYALDNFQFVPIVFSA